jgi:hypothetical protein
VLLDVALKRLYIEPQRTTDLDAGLFANAATDLWTEQGLRVTQADFTRQPLPDRLFNLVIANPPMSGIITCQGRTKKVSRRSSCDPCIWR